mgnify:CR=1 FL=1
MEAVYNRKLKAIELWVSGAMEKTHYSFAYGGVIAFYDKSEMSTTTSQHIRLIQKILKELGINYVVDNENKYSHILYDDV